MNKACLEISPLSSQWCIQLLPASAHGSRHSPHCPGPEGQQGHSPGGQQGHGQCCWAGLLHQLRGKPAHLECAPRYRHAAPCACSAQIASFLRAGSVISTRSHHAPTELCTHKQLSTSSSVASSGSGSQGLPADSIPLGKARNGPTAKCLSNE